MRRLSTLPIALLCCLGLACDASDTDEPSTTGPTSEDGATSGDDAAAGCDPQSGFDGDDKCLVPPAPADGFQVHVGPDDYTDPEQLETFLLQPGEETTECYHVPLDLGEPRWFYEREFRMRPGSHHLITRVLPAGLEQGWGPCSDRTDVIGTLSGTQNSVESIPRMGGELAPENEGLGKSIAARSTVEVELHFVNVTSEPILREAWINVLYKDESEISQPVHEVRMIGGLAMNVAPHSSELIQASCPITQQVRLVDVFGHFHANTHRFSAWRVRDGERLLFYEVFDWQEPETFALDSVTTNPQPDRDARVGGALSGQFLLQAGDAIEWECEVINEHDFPVTFGNRAIEADMCNLFGQYVSEPAQPGAMTCFRN